MFDDFRKINLHFYQAAIFLNSKKSTGTGDANLNGTPKAQRASAHLPSHEALKDPP